MSTPHTETPHEQSVLAIANSILEHFTNDGEVVEITSDLLVILAKGYLARAADPWTPIDGPDSLPKEAGDYWWTDRTTNQVFKLHYDPKGPKDYMVKTFSAWMPYTEPQPYTPAKEQI